MVPPQWDFFLAKWINLDEEGDTNVPQFLSTYVLGPSIEVVIHPTRVGSHLLQFFPIYSLGPSLEVVIHPTIVGSHLLYDGSQKTPFLAKKFIF